MGPDTTIATLRPGAEVTAMFACTRKDRLMTRTGSPYLALELRDRTGTVSARVFRDADAIAGGFDRGDVVSVAGRVERFRDELVLEVSSIARADAGDGVEPARFLPAAYRDLDELDGFFEHLAREVFDPGYRALLESIAQMRRSAPRGVGRRAPAPATTPTSAACSSTPSQSRRSRSRRVSYTRA